MNANVVKKLNKMAKPLLAELHAELRKSFADNKNMLAAIDKAEADKTYDYDFISEKPDFDRARKIAHQEVFCQEMGYEGVAELVKEVCLIPYADALRICKDKWSLSLLK